MPEFTAYPNEGAGDFAKRMKNKSKQGSLVRAAGRFMQSSEQKKKEKPSTSQY